MSRRNPYNSYYNRNRMTLNTAGYTPVVFNPIEFQPVEADYNILNKAMALQEARQKEAVQQVSTIKSALGKAREQLHKDDETMAWFDAKANDIENKINAYSRIGDDNGVINFAVQMAGDLSNDTELIGRIRTNQQYEAKKQELEKMVAGNKISQATANYYLEQNPYSYNPIKDENGKIIGSEDWNFSEQPVEDLKFDKLFVDAFRMVTPNKSNNVGSNYSNTYLNEDGSGLITNQRNKQSEWISSNEILEQARTILFGDSDWEAKIKQAYNVSYNVYEKNKNRLDELIASGDRSSSEYQMLSTIVNNEEQVFFPNGNAREQNTNTFLNFFDYQVLNSDSARKLGYYYEISNKSDAFHPITGNKEKTDVNPTLQTALSDEANQAVIEQKPASVTPLLIGENNSYNLYNILNNIATGFVK